MELGSAGHALLQRAISGDSAPGSPTPAGQEAGAAGAGAATGAGTSADGLSSFRTPCSPEVRAVQAAVETLFQARCRFVAEDAVVRTLCDFASPFVDATLHGCSITATIGSDADGMATYCLQVGGDAAPADFTIDIAWQWAVFTCLTELLGGWYSAEALHGAELLAAGLLRDVAGRGDAALDALCPSKQPIEPRLYQVRRARGPVAAHEVACALHPALRELCGALVELVQRRLTKWHANLRSGLREVLTREPAWMVEEGRAVSAPPTSAALSYLSMEAHSGALAHLPRPLWQGLKAALRHVWPKLHVGMALLAMKSFTPPQADQCASSADVVALVRGAAEQEGVMAAALDLDAAFGEAGAEQELLAASMALLLELFGSDVDDSQPPSAPVSGLYLPEAYARLARTVLADLQALPSWGDAAHAGAGTGGAALQAAVATMDDDSDFDSDSDGLAVPLHALSIPTMQCQAPDPEDDTDLVGAPLPAHVFCLPHPERVRLAVGLSSTAREGSTALTPAPCPRYGCCAFTLRGRLYMFGGTGIEVLQKALQQPLPPLDRISRSPRVDDALLRQTMRMLGFRVIGELVDQRGEMLPISQLLASRLRRVTGPSATRLVRNVITKATQFEADRAPVQLVDGHHVPVAYNKDEQVLVSWLNTARAEVEKLFLSAQPSLFTLHVHGSRYTYNSIALDPHVAEDKQQALQNLLARAAGHSIAAEWVQVPNAGTPLPAHESTVAVTIPTRSDPRVLLLSAERSRLSRLVCSVLRINAQGASTVRTPKLRCSARHQQGFTADRLPGEQNVIVYGGCNPHMTRQVHHSRKVAHGFFLLHARAGREGMYHVQDSDVRGEFPVPGPLRNHSSSMTSHGNLVLFGGAPGGGCGRDVWVASMLDCVAAGGKEFNPDTLRGGMAEPEARFRIAMSWVKVEGVAPQIRAHASMHRLPGTDTVLVFGGCSNQGTSLGDVWTGHIEAIHPDKMHSWGDFRSLSFAIGGRSKYETDSMPLWRMKWVSRRTKLPGEDDGSDWSYPRHKAASAILSGRLFVFGGLQSRRGGIVGEPRTLERAMERDYSTLLMSKSYSKAARKTSGGVGIHRYGVLTPVSCELGGIHADTHVLKLERERIGLAPSSLPDDLAWLWAGAASAQPVLRPPTGVLEAQDGPMWRVDPCAAALPADIKAQLDRSAGEGGGDEGGLNAGVLADVVLICAPPVTESGMAGRAGTDAAGQAVHALAAHRCIVASTIPWMWGALAAEEGGWGAGVAHPGFAAEAGPVPAAPGLHDDDEEALPAPPLQPALSLRRSVSVGETCAKPLLAAPLVSAASPQVVQVPFAPVDAMACILQFVYTGHTSIPSDLVPWVWGVLQCLGMCPEAKSVMKAARAAKAGRKGAKYRPTDKKWRHNVLLDVAAGWLPGPALPSITHFDSCPLPLVAIDTQLSKLCETVLSVQRSEGRLAARERVVAGSPDHQLNKRTVNGLRWLHSEGAFFDVHVQCLDASTEQPMFVGGHRAVLAARSRMWRGALCSSLATQPGSDAVPREVALGVGEGIALEVDDVTAFLQAAYSGELQNVRVEAAPLMLPLAAAHSMSRLASHCERQVVSGFDLEDPESAVGIWVYAAGLGLAGRRLRRVVANALSLSGATKQLPRTLEQFAEAGEMTPEMEAQLWKDVKAYA